MRDVDRFVFSSFSFEQGTKLIDISFDLRLKLVNRAKGEEILIHANTTTMNLVIFGSERDFGNTRDFVVPWIFL